MVHAIDHIQLAMPLGGEDVARRFWVGVMGFVEVPKPEVLAVRGGCWFVSGGAHIHVGGEKAFVRAQKAHPALAVADFEKCKQKLTSSGWPVTFGEEHGARRFHTQDPFGNRIEIVEEARPFVPAREQLVVEFDVRALGRSVSFYESLGFAVKRREGDFAEVTWEGVELYLAEHAALIGVPLPARPLVNVRVMVPDVDARWRLAQTFGARVVAPIDDRHYGLRDFTIADPDGYGLRFASPR